MRKREWLCAQQAKGENQHILPVQPLGLDLGSFVCLLNRQILLQRQPGHLWSSGLRILLKRAKRILAPLNFRGELPHRHGVQFDCQRLSRLGDELGLRLNHLRGRHAGKLRPEVLELSKGCRVKGLHLHACSTKAAQTSAELSGSAIGVGQREHSVGRVITFGNSIGDAMSNGAGLASAGSGKNAGGADQRFGCPTLFFIKSV